MPPSVGDYNSGVIRKGNPRSNNRPQNKIYSNPLGVNNQIITGNRYQKQVYQRSQLPSLNASNEDKYKASIEKNISVLNTSVESKPDDINN